MSSRIGHDHSMVMGGVGVGTAGIVGVEATAIAGIVATEGTEATVIVAITTVHRPDLSHMVDITLRLQQRLPEEL